MKKYKVLGLTFIMALSSTAVAQEYRDYSERNNESEIVMTKSELKSFLKMVAEKRKENLRRQAKNNISFYNAGTYRQQPPTMGVVVPQQGGNDLSQRIDHINSRLDNLIFALLGNANKGTVVNSVPSKQEDTTSLKKGDTCLENKIKELQQQLDALKGGSVVNDDNYTEEEVITITPERRSELEQLLAKYGHFKKQVFFPNNVATVSQADLTYIREVAKVLKQNPELSVVLEGYASPVGSPSYNKQLSMRRADNVQQSLENQGINSNRIVSSFKGEDHSVSEAKARRVDMSVIIKAQ